MSPWNRRVRDDSYTSCKVEATLSIDQHREAFTHAAAVPWPADLEERGCIV